jgi:hypothetical protein
MYVARAAAQLHHLIVLKIWQMISQNGSKIVTKNQHLGLFVEHVRERFMNLPVGALGFQLMLSCENINTITNSTRPSSKS